MNPASAPFYPPPTHRIEDIIHRTASHTHDSSLFRRVNEMAIRSLESHRQQLLRSPAALNSRRSGEDNTEENRFLLTFLSLQEGIDASLITYWQENFSQEKIDEKVTLLHKTLSSFPMDELETKVILYNPSTASDDDYFALKKEIISYQISLNNHLSILVKLDLQWLFDAYPYFNDPRVSRHQLLNADYGNLKEVVTQLMSLNSASEGLLLNSVQSAVNDINESYTNKLRILLEALERKEIEAKRNKGAENERDYYKNEGLQTFRNLWNYQGEILYDVICDILATTLGIIEEDKEERRKKTYSIIIENLDDIEPKEIAKAVFENLLAKGKLTQEAMKKYTEIDIYKHGQREKNGEAERRRKANRELSKENRTKLYQEFYELCEPELINIDSLEKIKKYATSPVQLPPDIILSPEVRLKPIRTFRAPLAPPKRRPPLKETFTRFFTKLSNQVTHLLTSFWSWIKSFFR